MIAGVILDVAALVSAFSVLAGVTIAGILLLGGRLKNLAVDIKGVKVSAEAAAEAAGVAATQATAANSAVNNIGPGEQPLKDRVTGLEANTADIRGILELHVATTATNLQAATDRLDLLSLALVGRKISDMTEAEVTGEHPVVE